MALNWNFKERYGIIKCKNVNDYEYELRMYQGNAMLIILYEDDNDKTYVLNMFFADKKHFINCIKDKELNFYDQWKEIIFNKIPTTDMWYFIKEITKKGIKVTIDVH